MQRPNDDLLAGADWTVGKSVIYRIKFNKKKKKKMKKNEKIIKKEKIERKKKEKKNIKKRKFIGKDQNK